MSTTIDIDELGTTQTIGLDAAPSGQEVIAKNLRAAGSAIQEFEQTHRTKASTVNSRVALYCTGALVTAISGVRHELREANRRPTERVEVKVSQQEILAVLEVARRSTISGRLVIAWDRTSLHRRLWAWRYRKETERLQRHR